MRILYIAPANSVHSQRWINYFGNKGYTIDLINTNVDEMHLDMINTNIHNVTMPLKSILIIKYFTRYPMLIYKLNKLINKINPDIIHIHWFGLMASLISMVASKPIISTPWGSDLLILPTETKKRKFMVDRIINNAKYFICDAEHLKAALVKYGAKKDEISIISFGIDTDKFNPQAKNDSFRNDLGLKENFKIVISTRGLAAIYDVETLIKAAKHVLRGHSKTYFIIIGDGPQKMELIKLSKSLEICDNIIFTGRVSDDEYLQYLTMSDVYVSTSLSDGGLASSTAEAMSCEIPVISTNFGENSKWIQHGKSGLLFEAKDVNKLTENILQLINDNEQSVQLSKEGRKIVLESHAYHTSMEKVDNIYNTLVKSC
jgi:L-malate glycosyltransferase